MSGIAGFVIRETPVSVIDFETTGMHPGRDRVVEMTVVRCEPGEEPRLVLDTLVNPERKVGAIDIHGITDDVRDAPRFGDVAGDLLDAIKGSVFTAYNVYFDLKFLRSELERLGVTSEPPHFCSMYLRPMLGIGKRRKLDEACESQGIELARAHTAADDAMATAKLYRTYLDQIEQRGARTFGELGKLKSYKFVESFHAALLPGPEDFNLAPSGKSFSRSGHVPTVELTDEQLAIRAYWDVIKSIVADLQVTEDKVAYAKSERRKLGLSEEQIRYLHALAFAAAIAQFINDQHLDDGEVRKLRKLRAALSAIGWCPSD